MRSMMWPGWHGLPLNISFCSKHHSKEDDSLVWCGVPVFVTLTAVLDCAWKLFRCCGSDSDVKLRPSKCFEILKMNRNDQCWCARSTGVQTYCFLCLLCATYLLSQWYFSYLSWTSVGLIASDLGSASEIKTFSPAFSCCFGGVSWFDRKSLPHDGSAITWRYRWLLLTLGLCPNNALRDLWQEASSTREHANE